MNTFADLSGDSTDGINRELLALKEGERLNLPFGKYVVGGSLVEPKVQYWGFGGDYGEYPEIRYTGDGYFITMTKRGAFVSDLLIYGDHGNPGILMKNTSNCVQTRLRLSGFKKALTFDHAHDCKGISSIELYGNGTDVTAQGGSSSLRFRDVSMLFGEKCLDAGTITNFLFDGCTFAARKTDDVNPVEIYGAIYQSRITNSRFESRGVDHKPVNQLSVLGRSRKYPVQSLKIDTNYFTGDTINHVLLDKYCDSVTILDNHFMSIPENADILHAPIPHLTIDRNHTLFKHHRDVTVNEI